MCLCLLPLYPTDATLLLALVRLSDSTPRVNTYWSGSTGHPALYIRVPSYLITAMILRPVIPAGGIYGIESGTDTDSSSHPRSCPAPESSPGGRAAPQRWRALQGRRDDLCVWNLPVWIRVPRSVEGLSHRLAAERMALSASTWAGRRRAARRRIRRNGRKGCEQWTKDQGLQQAVHTRGGERLATHSEVSTLRPPADYAEVRAAR